MYLARSRRSVCASESVQLAVSVSCFALILSCGSAAGAQEMVRLGPEPGCGECTIELKRTAVLSPQGNIQWNPGGVSVSTGPDGRFAVAPTWWDPGVSIFDSEGRYLTRIGRSGEGPGEYREIQSVAYSADGDLFVIDPILRRVSVLNPDLEFVRAFRIDGNPAQVRFLPPDSVVVHVEQSRALRLFVAGEQIAAFGRSEPDDQLAWFRRIAVGSDGMIWAARRGRYQIDGYRTDGRRVKTIIGDFDWFVPMEERRAGQRGGRASVVDLAVDADNNLWLLTVQIRPVRPHEASEQTFRIHVIDPEEGVLLASETLDENLIAGGFVTGAPDIRVFTLAADENGIVTIHVWNSRMVGVPSVSDSGTAALRATSQSRNRRTPSPATAARSSTAPAAARR